MSKGLGNCPHCGKELPREVLTIGNVSIDEENRTLKTEQGKKQLTLRQYAIFKMLANRFGGTVTREEIHKAVWDRVGVIGRSIDVHLTAVRACIESIHGDLLIESSRGTGYKMILKSEKED